MTNPTRLFFAIPFYRGGHFLTRTLKSVQEQTSSAWHCIVFDDGDEPETSALVASFQDHRIQYRKNPENLGMVGNWNQCLDHSDREFVTILHADDELEPHYATAMLDLMDNHCDAAAGFCDTHVIDDESQPVFSFPDFYKTLIRPKAAGDMILQGENGLNAVMRGNFVFCPTLCYRTAKLSGLRFDDRWRMVQDLDLITKFLLSDQVLVGLREKAYRYRRHLGNATTEYTANALRFQEEIAIFEKLAAACAERQWTYAGRTCRSKQIIKLNLGFCLAKDICQLRLSGATQKARLLSALMLGRNLDFDKLGLSRLAGSRD